MPSTKFTRITTTAAAQAASGKRDQAQPFNTHARARDGLNPREVDAAKARHEATARWHGDRIAARIANSGTAGAGGRAEAQWQRGRAATKADRRGGK